MTMPESTSLQRAGFALAQGQSRTVALGLLADGTSAEWHVSAREVAPPTVDDGSNLVPTAAPRPTFS